LILYTPKVWNPNSKGIYEWHKQGKLYFREDLPEKALSVSVSLFKGKK